MSWGQPGSGRIVTVGGGKGGVGKSLVAGNLAIAIAELGYEVALVDGDLGAANLHTHFGITQPKASLADFLTRSIEDLESLRLETRVPRLTLIPGAGAVPGIANLAWQTKRRLCRHLRQLQAEVIVLDVGAGTSFNVVDLFALGDLRLVVATPQLTSLQNAYAFAKATAWREIHTLLRERKAGPRALALQPDETETVTAFLRRLEAESDAESDAESGGAVEIVRQASQVLEAFGLRLVGNQVFADPEARTLFALSRMLHDFLGVNASVLGALRASRRIHESVGRRVPYLVDAPSERNASTFRAMAHKIVEEDVAGLREVRRGAALPAPGERQDPAPATPLDLEDETPPSQGIDAYVDRRRRYEVAWPGLLVHQGRRWEVTIRDISEEGARIETPHVPALGQHCTLRFDAAPGRPAIEVEVCNVHLGEGVCGLRFARFAAWTRELVARAAREARATSAASGPRGEREASSVQG